MATAQMDAVIRQLRRTVLRQDAAGWTDGQLLAAFIDRKDEAAFEALVRRHGSMVFGVCRRVVGQRAWSLCASTSISSLRTSSRIVRGSPSDWPGRTTGPTRPLVRDKPWHKSGFH